MGYINISVVVQWLLVDSILTSMNSTSIQDHWLGLPVVFFKPRGIAKSASRLPRLSRSIKEYEVAPLKRPRFGQLCPEYEVAPMKLPRLAALGPWPAVNSIKFTCPGIRSGTSEAPRACFIWLIRYIHLYIYIYHMKNI